MYTTVNPACAGMIRPLDGGGVQGAVNPACAGMIPGYAEATSPPPGKPRVCGDDPDLLGEQCGVVT